MPYLVYDDNITNKAICIIHETSGFNIGRSMDNDVRLREDSSVSRRHCTICRTTGNSDFLLRDLGSSNGTFLNNSFLQNSELPLRDGDLIGVGKMCFVFYAHNENPYDVVDTTTLYVNSPAPDISSPEEYPFNETVSLEAINPNQVSAETDVFPSINGFEFIRLIGKGNYSSTYLVFQTSLKRTVVLKTFHIEGLDEYQKSAFFQHVSNAGKLNHPYILGFIDAGITDHLCYVAMQYAPQGTMTALISQYKQGIAETDVVGYMTHLVEAMVHASGLGLIHADISPSNILFNENFHAVFADFGLTTWISQVFQTNRKYFFGSTYHMPPEQTLDQSLDWTCDQYSLGAIFFELLTGTPPFTAPNAHAMIEKHLREKIRFPPEIQISEKIKSIIIRMMAKTPEERFPSWQAVEENLKAKARSPKSKKNAPLQKKGLANIKKTGSGIKIPPKKRIISMKK